MTLSNHILADAPKLLVFMGFGALVMAIAQLKRVRQIQSDIGKVVRTATSPLSSNLKCKIGDSIEINEMPIAVGAVSAPISLRPCLWWAFEVVQLKAAQRHGAVSVPVASATASSEFLFFEGDFEILAVKIIPNNIQTIRTHEETGILDLNERVKNFFESSSFRRSQNPQTTDFMTLYPSYATTVTEDLVPLGRRLHCHGKVAPWDAETLARLKKDFSDIFARKPLMPVTIVPDSEIFMSIDTEDQMLNLTRRSLWTQSLLLFFYFAMAFYFLFTAFT